MLDYLTKIPGPTFLVLYWGFIGILFLLDTFVFPRNSRGYQPRLPDLNPIELAFLRGGWQASFQTALFSLWDRGLIKIEPDRSKKDLKLSAGDQDQSPEQPLSALEKELIWSLQRTHSYKEMKKDSFLGKRFRQALEPIERKLQSLNLILEPKEFNRRQSTMYLCLCFPLFTGSAKLILGIYHHRPFFFLLVSLVVSLLLINFLPSLKPKTVRGRQYLKEKQQLYSWMKDKSIGARLGDVPPAFGLAAFGLSFLSLHAVYSGVFGPMLAANAAGLSGISGSDGGCGSSGGCGGGGCGGGCGGCGG